MTDAPTTGHCHNEIYMKTTHPFVAPVLGSTQSKVNMEAYEQAIDQYNEGNYLGAFYQLLDHLNPEFRTKYGNADGTEFHIPHGSILVNIRIADDRLHISADFLVLPEKGRVAMLRQVADLNINRLMLARFRKEGDKLMMEYACPLSQSHPHKLYFILRNICHVGAAETEDMVWQFQLLQKTFNMVEHLVQTLVRVTWLIDANNLYLVELVQAVQTANVLTIATCFTTETS